MMTHTRFVVYLLILLSLALPSLAYSVDDLKLKQQINKQIDDEKLVGVTWSLISEGSTFIGSSGLSNKSMFRAMEPAQKIHVGSVSKTVLAVGVLRLITVGKLSLNSSVEDLLPAVKINNSWRNDYPITVKHLLEHTAGLDNIRMWQFLNATVKSDTPLINAFPTQNANLLEVRTTPGTQYSYSNMGYTLLAMVIEAVSGERYERYLDHHLLRPLGMHDSTFHFVTQHGQYYDESLAMGYIDDGIPQFAVPNYLRPAGQFTTTAPDMAKFMLFVLNKGMLNSAPFIRPDLMNRLGSPYDTDAEKTGLKIGHGLAFAIRDRHHVVGMCHPGTTLGFRANMCLFPNENKAFFYSVNTDSETANYEQLNSIFIEYLDISKAPLAKPENKLMNLSGLAGVYLLAPNNMAEFEWLDMMFNFKWLTQQGDKLILQSLQASDRLLLPINENLLRATDRTQASHTIFMREDNGVYLSDGLNTYKKTSAFLIVIYWFSLICGLLGLIYIVIFGGFSVLFSNVSKRKQLLWPLINILAFSAPIFLYTQQSFLNFGELTGASFLLAVFSGVFPVILTLSLVNMFRSRELFNWSFWDKCDGVALIALLQLCFVLFCWDVLPIIFWK